METVKLEASSAAAGQQFGRSVAISDDGYLVAVGAQKSSATGDDTGGAYVLRTSDDGASWAQVAELVESDAQGAAGDGAKVVALAGDFVAVGCPQKDGTAGAVYLFRTADGGASWSQVAKLTAGAPQAGAGFGASVAVSSELDVVVVGAAGETDFGQAIERAGAVYGFRTPDGGATWPQTARLAASDAAAADGLGGAVATSGNLIVAGAHQEDAEAGAVYVFMTADGGATWAQVAKGTAAGATAGDHFGVAVAVDGALLVAGAQHAGPGDAREGAV